MATSRKSSGKPSPQEVCDAAVEALCDVWRDLCEHAAFELNGSSAEGAILDRVGRNTRAATDLANDDISDVDSYIRCVYALLPGYIRDVESDLLASIWMAECHIRDSGEDPDVAQLESNSVAERILISAVRWMRSTALRQSGADVLVDMVERFIKGEFWNDSHWAIGALLRYQDPRAPRLLERMRASPLGKEQFQDFLDGLAAGNPRFLAVADHLVDKADAAAAQVTLPPPIRKALDEFDRAAAAYEKALADLE